MDQTPVPKKIIIKNQQSPGDIVMLTAAVRDLKKSHPEYLIDVRTSASQIWQNNPYITKLDDNDPEVKIINAEYPLIHKSNTAPYHFIHGFRMDLEKKLNISIPATEFKGDIHISKLEKSWMSQVEEMGIKHDHPIWLINSGGKSDFTNKIWSNDRFQQVVNALFDKITFVQIGEKNHLHIPLKHTINLLGKTDVRQLIRLTYHCSGILTGVSFPMHLAKAVEVKPNRPKIRPCVVIAGGREGNTWESYEGHQYLHTIGCLPCCQTGCWKSRVVPLNDGDSKDSSLCQYPTIVENGQIIPKCLDLITVDKVISSINMYLEMEKYNK